jgi:alkane 1-monooxygenase
MFLVAVIPPLWFRVMDPLLLSHTDRDPQRINFDPKRREALCARYDLGDVTTRVEQTPSTTRAAA